MKKQEIVRTEPRLDVFPVLTVFERVVRREVKLPNGITVFRRTNLSVRKVVEWLTIIRPIKQRHRPIDERHSGLGVRFNPKKPKWIFIPQELTKNHIPAWLRARYDYDIVRNVHKFPDGSVDMDDMKRKREAARLKRWDKRPVVTWCVFTITVSEKGEENQQQSWSDRHTRKRILEDPFYRGVECRRRPETPHIVALRSPSGRAFDRGRFGLVAGDGFDCERKLKRVPNPEQFGPVLEFVSSAPAPEGGSHEASR